MAQSKFFAAALTARKELSHTILSLSTPFYIMFLKAKFCHSYQLRELLNLSAGILFEGLTMCWKRFSISSCGTNQTLLMVLRQGQSYVAL
jgi:hypothetical protein